MTAPAPTCPSVKILQRKTPRFLPSKGWVPLGHMVTWAEEGWGSRRQGILFGCYLGGWWQYERQSPWEGALERAAILTYMSPIPRKSRQTGNLGACLIQLQEFRESMGGNLQMAVVFLIRRGAKVYLVIYPKELNLKTGVRTKTCTQTFLAVLFIIAKSWEHLNIHQLMKG